MDLKEIQNLIRFVAKSGASEVKLEMDDVKITIKTGADDDKGATTIVQQMPAMPPVAAAPAAPVATPAAETPAAPAAVLRESAQPEQVSPAPAEEGPQEIHVLGRHRLVHHDSPGFMKGRQDEEVRRRPQGATEFLHTQKT